VTALRQSWLNHLRNHPGARALDVARALGVSEAELLYSRVDDDALLLRPDWEALLAGLPSLGTVMALVRNEHVVHELTGPFERISYTPHMAGVYGEIIDQRLILARWKTAIACSVETRRGVLQSIQVFDGAGDAVLKLYSRPDTDLDAWFALTEGLADPAPPPRLDPTLVELPADPADDAIDAAALSDRWAAMTDTHQVHPLLRELGVGREQALRLLGPDWAVPVDPAALTDLLVHAAADAEPLMVFVGNTGAIQIFSGAVRRILPTAGWLNVMDPAFNLHVRLEGLAAAWVVRKPTDRGLVWSMEVFSTDGTLLVQLFGKRTEDRSQADSWHALLDLLQERHRHEERD